MTTATMTEVTDRAANPIRAGKAFLQLAGRTDGFQSGLDAARLRLSAFGLATAHLTPFLTPGGGLTGLAKAMPPDLVAAVSASAGGLLALRGAVPFLAVPTYADLMAEVEAEMSRDAEATVAGH